VNDRIELVNPIEFDIYEEDGWIVGRNDDIYILCLAKSLDGVKEEIKEDLAFQIENLVLEDDEKLTKEARRVKYTLTKYGVKFK